MKVLTKWDIQLAKVPFEEDNNIIKKRPVLILDNKVSVILSFKMTSKNPRNNFAGEYKIIEWEKAGLRKPSTVRCSKLLKLNEEYYIKYIGKLQIQDIKNIQIIVKKEFPEYSHLVEKFIPDDEPNFEVIF